VRSRRGSTAAVVSLSAVVLAAGCSHGSSSPSPPPTSTGANAIVIGLINTEDAPVGSFPDLRRGAIAAERYVNDTFGGVGHRPIEIVPCTTSGTPESSQACANKLLNRHPVAVIGGVDLGAASSLPPLQAAGVPYVGGTPVATDALTSGGSFMLTGGTATEVLGEVSYAAKTLHVTRMSAVYVDVPGLLATAVGLLSTIARKLGVTQFKTVPVQPDAPDITPALAAAASIHPQAILAVFPGQTCTRVIEGVAAVGGGARMMYPSLCAGQQALAAAGGAGEGSVIASGYRPYTDTGDKDVAVYLSALHRYDSSLKPSLLSQAGFSVVMDLRQVMSEMTGALTAKSLSTALSATRAHANFMSAPFTCDGKQIPLLRSLCNASTQISVIHGGKLDPVGAPIDTAPVADLAVG
jgi:branched-chain amino acid transport system substrate-binding protein